MVSLLDEFERKLFHQADEIHQKRVSHGQANRMCNR